jgi:plasmid stability protein
LTDPGDGRYADIMLSSQRMAQLVVRNLEDEVKRRLQRRARRHGRSTEEEVREILRDAVKSDRERPRPLGERLAARFAGLGLDEGIPEIRGQQATPAGFRK